ncbi:MAG: Glu-tRNA(Gln) amidotransferase GatDE subunit E [Candidatus Altiarchaeales archaeon ex4484_2]|nr:MAG: Glu-tRNA(Gln) amidotransferase GatDE subunit E [Candidatus Altiarchaeales archaeon ex4484_2]
MDYKKLGFKAGIEIHQQLDTHKLFCSCPSKIREEEPDIKIERSMRAVAGEIGDVDPAALHEFLRDRRLVYEAYRDTNCLVELDEEPPHMLNQEALEIAVEISLLLNATVVDEIQVMRKTVIDGSNTSGFQRTMLVAVDGFLDTSEGRVGIPLICLEEDAARKIGGDSNTTIYRLDRLGIPLVELGTSPDIKNPNHAREVAEKLGLLLRATGKVKRGLGTIRQDLNVSIIGGERIEIKGVQDLRLITKVISREVERQIMLVEVKKKLEERGVKDSDLTKEPIDLTEEFRETRSKLFRKKMDSGAKVYGILLPGFKELLGNKLGPELAQYARSESNVKGIIHSDELPGYGITVDESRRLREKLGLDEKDAFALVLEKKQAAEKAIGAIYGRCLKALEGVPQETRRSTGDGGTEYMRPLPGSARMYPETDEPLVKVTEKEISWIRSGLPRYPEELMDEYLRLGLSKEMANQMLRSRWSQSFTSLVEEYPKVNPTLMASTLVSAPKEIRRRFNVDVGHIDEKHFRDLFGHLQEGDISQDSVLDVLLDLARNPAKTVGEAISKVGVGVASRKEIEAVVDKLVEENRDFIKKQGLKAVGPLTGKVMGELGGRANGKVVSKVLTERMGDVGG